MKNSETLVRRPVSLCPYGAAPGLLMALWLCMGCGTNRANEGVDAGDASVPDASEQEADRLSEDESDTAAHEPEGGLPRPVDKGPPEADAAQADNEADSSAEQAEPEPTADADGGGSDRPNSDENFGSEGEHEGGAGSSDRGRLPASLREACMAWCDAQYATDCAPLGSSVEVCDLQCVASVSTQRDFCIEEYTERTRCLAEGGFECVNDTPVPSATCASKTVAYSECAQELPCKMYCAAAFETGCVDDELECREQCIEDSANDDSTCEARQNSYVLCVGQLGLSCEHDQIIPDSSCLSQLFTAAECRNDRDVCSTWCEGADALACGDENCVEACNAARQEADCGVEYQRMLECGISYGDVSCSEDGLQTDADSAVCELDVKEYADCVGSAEN